MRLIDADVLKKALNKMFDLVDVLLFDDVISTIDNAPTVDAYTEDDVKTAIKEGHQVGYEMAKAKYERPTGEWIEDVIEELESRKDYGEEYAQAIEDVIVILNAKFGGRE